MIQSVVVLPSAVIIEVAHRDVRFGEIRREGQGVVGDFLYFGQLGFVHPKDEPVPEDPIFGQARNRQSKIRVAIQRLLIESGRAIQWRRFERALRLAFLVFAFQE